MKSNIHHFAILALFAGLVFGTPGQAQGQKQGLVSMHMEPVIAGQEVPFKSLGTTLKKHTRLEVSPDLEETADIQFFYGIGKGRELAGPFASEPVFAKKKGLLALKGGTSVASPWDAFDDPLVGFVDPLLGFSDPLLGFDDPRAMVINHEEQYGAPAEAMRAIWEDGGTFGKSDAYGLVVFAMSGKGQRAQVLHAAMLVPFHVTEGKTRKQRP